MNGTGSEPLLEPKVSRVTSVLMTLNIRRYIWLLSILDLAFIGQGSVPADALHHSLDLAQHAERWGYRRFWLAEHHNMVGIASAATSIVIGYVAGGTKTIRVGAGGIMLPNHSPIVIAEQFGTLEWLYPGRIDLGLAALPAPISEPCLRFAAIPAAPIISQRCA